MGGGLAISLWIVHNISRSSLPGSIVQIVDLHTLTCHQDIVRGFSRQVDSWRLFHGTNQQVSLIQAHPIRCIQMHPWGKQLSLRDGNQGLEALVGPVEGQV